MSLILILRNVSGGTAVSDYDCEVRVNDRPIARGRIVGHRRADGWRTLVQRATREAVTLRGGEPARSGLALTFPLNPARDVRENIPDERE